MVPDDNNSQIGIELVENQIYLLDSNWNIKNEMFRRLSYLSYSLGYLRAVSFLRNSHRWVPTGG